MLARLRPYLAGLAASLLVTVVLVAVCGVPSPPGATTSGLPRIAWSVLGVAEGAGLRVVSQTTFLGWHPDGGMVVRALDGLRSVPHRLGEPDGVPAALALPQRTGAIAFCPDPTRRLAVYGADEGGTEHRQLYRFELDDARSIPLTTGAGGNWLGPWSRAGDRIAFANNRRNSADRDLYVMDPADPSTETMVLQVEGSWYVADWSPAGDRILASQYVSVTQSHPHVVDVATGTATPLLDLDTPVAFSDLVWSADDDVVYVVTDARGEFSQLMRVDVGARAMTPLGDPPAWDVLSVEASDDRSRLAVVLNEDGYRRPYLVDPVTGSWTPLPLPEGPVSNLEFDPAGTELGFTTTGDDGVSSVMSYALADGTLRAWTTPPPDEGAPLPAPRLIAYPTFDEGVGVPRPIPAFVLDPPEHAPRPAPVVIRIHGGPESQSSAGTNVIYNAVRRELGLAIIAPNVRGSRGYGKTYVTLDDGRKREDSVRDIGALLDWIEAEPDYDADRVIVYGGSYGGYMVLASMVHYPDRIRCGIDSVGISNFVTFLENTKTYRRDLRRAEYGDERDPAMRRFLESISPANHAEKIRGDLLVFQGANDPRVPVTESRQMVERLRALGREVWYVEFDNEGHGVRLPPNIAYSAAVSLAFAQRCLEPRPW